MKARSIHQPYASAIGIGAKRIETTPLKTNYRGPLAICAAARINKTELVHFGSMWGWCGALEPLGLRMGGDKALWELLPFGAVIATVDLVDCRPVGDFTLAELETTQKRGVHGHPWTERMMGDFTLGRYGWVLENPKLLSTPIPIKGQQGMFNIPDDLMSPTENGK